MQNIYDGNMTIIVSNCYDIRNGALRQRCDRAVRLTQAIKRVDEFPRFYVPKVELAAFREQLCEKESAAAAQGRVECEKECDDEGSSCTCPAGA